MIIDPSTNRPVEAAPSRSVMEPKECPRCKGPKTKFEVFPPGFGGYYKTVCPCGEVIAEGREIL